MQGSKNFRPRTFVFTNFKLDFDYEEMLARVPDVRYVAYGLEKAPSTGRLHHQGWIYFKSKQSDSKKARGKLAQLIFKAGTFMEGMQGSLQQNDTYCSKNTAGELVEFGERPKQGDRGDLKDVVARVTQGERVDDILIDDPVFYHQYGRTLRDAEDVAARHQKRTWMTVGVWVHGPAGVGKSHYSQANYSPITHYTKNLKESFWNGYTGQPIVCLNEFTGQIDFQEMMDIVDKWPYCVPMKCREQRPFLARTLFINTCHAPEEVWPTQMEDPQKRRQFARRFVTIAVSEDTSPHEFNVKMRDGVLKLALLAADNQFSRTSKPRALARVIQAWKTRHHEDVVKREVANHNWIMRKGYDQEICFDDDGCISAHRPPVDGATFGGRAAPVALRATLADAIAALNERRAKRYKVTTMLPGVDK